MGGFLQHSSMGISSFSSRTHIFLGHLFFVSVLLVGFPAQAAEYVPLVGIPGLTDKGNQNLPDYVNAVYLLTIALGALIGVVRIALAGVKYALSDIVTHKEEAKHDITGVLLGLAVLLIPFIVLNTINPNLTRLDILSGLQKIKTMSAGTGTVTDSSIGTQNITPKERAELKASCGESYYKTPNGQECCGAEGYTGKLRCDAEVVKSRTECGVENWDEGIGVCLTSDSAYTYSTKQGGGWGSETEEQWIKRCGGTEATGNLEKTIDTEMGTISYSCVKTTPYLEEDLNKIKTLVEDGAENNIEPSFPIRLGTDEEWNNIRAICQTNLPGSIAIKDPDKKMYVCKK